MPTLLQRALPASVWLSILVYTAIVLAVWWRVPAEGFWINDNGLKYIQTMMLIDSAGDSAALDAPAMRLVAGDFIAAPRVVIEPIDGQWHVLYPTAFPRLGAGGARIVGLGFVMLLPVLAGIVAVILWTLACAQVSRRPAWLIPLMALASPVTFYHWTYWEHTLQLAGVALAFLGVLRGMRTGSLVWFAIGGFGMGVAILFRQEQLLLALCLGIALLALQRRLAPALCFAAGAVLPVALLLWQNMSDFGHPLGIHFQKVVATDREAQVGDRWDTITNVLVGLRSHPLALGLALVAAAGATVAGWTRRRGVAAAACCGCLAAALGVRTILMAQVDPFLAALQFGGLAATAPIFFLGLGRGMRGASPRARLLVYTTLGFVVLTALTCPYITSIGIHFGPRILLSVYIPLGILAAWKLSALLRCLGGKVSLHRGLALAAGALLLVGLADSATGAWLLNHQTQRNAARSAFLRHQPEQFIATDVFWFSPLIPEITLSRNVAYMEPRDFETLGRFIAAADASGERTLLFASSLNLDTQSGFTELKVPGAARGTTIMDLRLYRIDIAALPE